MGDLLLVDSDDLTSVADKIRTKAGVSDTLEFPSEFNSTIEAIPSGSTEINSIVRLTTGTFEEVNNG